MVKIYPCLSKCEYLIKKTSPFYCLPVEAATSTIPQIIFGVFLTVVAIQCSEGLPIPLILELLRPSLLQCANKCPGVQDTKAVSGRPHPLVVKPAAFLG